MASHLYRWTVESWFIHDILYQWNSRLVYVDKGPNYRYCVSF